MVSGNPKGVEKNNQPFLAAPARGRLGGPFQKLEPARRHLGRARTWSGAEKRPILGSFLGFWTSHGVPHPFIWHKSVHGGIY